MSDLKTNFQTRYDWFINASNRQFQNSQDLYGSLKAHALDRAKDFEFSAQNIAELATLANAAVQEKATDRQESISLSLETQIYESKNQ